MSTPSYSFMNFWTSSSFMRSKSSVLKLTLAASCYLIESPSIYVKPFSALNLTRPHKVSKLVTKETLSMSMSNLRGIM